MSERKDIANKIYNIVMGYYDDTPIEGASKDSLAVADYVEAKVREARVEVAREIKEKGTSSTQLMDRMALFNSMMRKCNEIIQQNTITNEKEV